MSCFEFHEVKLFDCNCDSWDELYKFHKLGELHLSCLSLTVLREVRELS